MSLFVMTMLLCAEALDQDLLSFTASEGDQVQDLLSFTASEGDQVTLPCGPVRRDQQSCGRTSWYFRSAVGEPEVEVTERGHLGEDERAGASSERLKVSADCSVVIRRVQQQDVGLYVCRAQEPPTEALLYLSVVFMESHDAVIFYCSVFTFHGCWHSVRWMFSGSRSNTRTLNSTCSTRVTLKTPLRSDSGDLLHCSVTDERSGQVLLCDVSSGSSCQKTGRPPSAEDTQIYRGRLRLIVVSAGLVVLIVTVVLVNIWTRPSGPGRGQ